MEVTVILVPFFFKLFLLLLFFYLASGSLVVVGMKLEDQEQRIHFYPNRVLDSIL